MKTIKKLLEIMVISVLLFINTIICLAQTNKVTINKVNEGLEGYASEKAPSHHYYGCPECKPLFAYESNESFLQLDNERIDIKERLTDIPLMEFYWGETKENKYLLFFSRIRACGGAICDEWYYHVVPLNKSPQDECRMISLCQLRISESGQDPTHEAVFRGMIERWEKDHRCFKD